MARRWRGTVLALGLAAAASAAAGPSGSELFADNCAVCHQADGSGSPGFIPPLAGTLGNYLRVDGGRKYLMTVLTHGLAGPIKVSGTPYASNMPNFSGQLSAEEIAAVLNHVMKGLDQPSTPSDFQPFTAAEVESAKEDASVDPSGVREMRETVIARMKEKGLER